MSNQDISVALEKRLSSMPDGIYWKMENTAYTEQDGVPFGEVFVLFAEPDNPSLGDGFYRERGYLQVNLRYPINEGAGAASIKAAAVRSWFTRGLPLTENSVTTIIDRTPQILSGRIEGNRYVIPVVVPFFANIEPE